MKNRFKRQYESLIQQRSRERDRKFDARLVKVQQEYHARNLLNSSSTVVAMHRELEREFRESVAECVRAAEDVMADRPAVLPLPGKRAVVQVCLKMIARRKAVLEEIFLSRTRNILDSLMVSSLIAPHRSVNEDFFQLQCDNARVEIRAKHSELFWLKVHRVQNLVPLLKLRPLIFLGVLVALYSVGFEIAEPLSDFYGKLTGAVLDSAG